MKHPEEAEDPRRRLLIQALAAGVFSMWLPGNNALAESIFGSRPTKLPKGQSIYRIRGEAWVNGKAANMETRIKPGDTVQTGKDSELIFVVNGNHSMILREDSHLETEAVKDTLGSLLINGLRILTGKLLSVSRHAKIQVRTTTASKRAFSTAPAGKSNDSGRPAAR